MAPLPVLHHDASSGFDWISVLVIVLVLAAVGGLGYLIWWLFQKRRYGT